MAVMLERMVKNVRENKDAVSKDDVAKLQALVEAFKDELDGLGVRTSDLNDAVHALDERTKLAQNLSLHADVWNSVSMRNRTRPGRLIDGSAAPVDPLVDAYLYSDASNTPFSYSRPGNFLATNSKLTLGYTLSDNVALSLPIHIFYVGLPSAQASSAGAFTSSSGIDIWPTLALNVKQAGAINGLTFKAGLLDDFVSSRTGLAFTAPTGTQIETSENSLQPDQRGVSVSGTLLGLTDFRFSFSGLDQTYLNTGALIAPGQPANVSYLTPVVPGQYGYNYAVLPAASTSVNQTDTFGPFSSPISQLYLSKKAIAGTLVVSSYSAAGGAPSFSYVDSLNAVVFTTPLPVGAVIQLTYVGGTASLGDVPQRYMINGRINHAFKRWTGAEVGLTFNRIFDLNAQNAISGFALVSNTVVGLDFQAPLTLPAFTGHGVAPTMFAEFATNKRDSAAVTGMKMKVREAEVSLQYQAVGANYLDGAPLRYLGNPPALLSNYGSSFLPDFMGFSNTLGLSAQYAGQFGVAAGSPAGAAAGNPAYTYVYPAYNPFRGQGPFYFQAFAPNSRGYTLTAKVPLAFKKSPVDASLSYQRLQEITPNSLMASVFGSSFASNVRMTLDSLTGSVAFSVPVAGHKVRLHLASSWDRLSRPDESLSPYYPFALQNSVGQIVVANPAAGVLAGSPALSGVSFYPNYVDVRRSDWSLGADVPLTGGLSFQASYDMQRYGGSYAPPGNGRVPPRT